VSAKEYPVPEDGIVICSRCGKQVDLNELDSEAFVCERHPESVFCSHTCLREHVIEECGEE